MLIPHELLSNRNTDKLYYKKYYKQIRFKKGIKIGSLNQYCPDKWLSILTLSRQTTPPFAATNYSAVLVLQSTWRHSADHTTSHYSISGQWCQKWDINPQFMIVSVPITGFALVSINCGLMYCDVLHECFLLMIT
jgi:hypothetical protein